MPDKQQRVEIQRGRKSQVIWLSAKRCQVGRTIQYQGQQWEVVTVYYQTRESK